MIFHWTSEYLKQYGDGNIIVEAQSVEEARKKVLERFKAWDMEENSWNYNDWADEDDVEDIERRLNILKNDISSDPINNEVFFFLGSN